MTAPMLQALARRPPALPALPALPAQTLTQTGPHCDKAMSHPRRDDLGLPQPDIDLEVGLPNCDRRMPEEINRVLTGTGGLLGDNHALGGPCSTMRDPTERPITVEQGPNTLVGRNPAATMQGAAERITANLTCWPAAGAH